MSKKFEDNEQFRNWIKGVLGIDCLHDGLVEFVDKETERQWGINVQTIQNRCKLKSFDCKECTIVNLLPDHAGGSCLNKNPDECNCSKRRKKNKRKCPLNGACGIFYDMVIGEHVKKQPKWDNTKVENWRNNHWEYAKCFIPGHGHIDDDTSANTDTAALLSICLNNNDIRGLLGDPGTLEKSKSNRNELLHSGRMEITKEKLAEVLANMKAVLSTDAFSGYACARLAIDSIEKLERDEIKVTIQTDITARKTALKSIVSKKKEIENEIKDREDEVNKGIEGDRENKDSGEMSINDLYKETAKLTKAEEDHTTSISKHLNTLKDEVKAMQLSIQNHEDDLKAITEGLSSQSCLLKTMRQDQIEHGKELKDTHEDLKKVLVGIESLGKTNFVKEFPLPRIRVVMVVKNVDGTKEKIVSEFLVEVGNSMRTSLSVANKQWEPVERVFLSVLHDLNDGTEDVLELESECVAIYIQCYSLQALVQLCREAMHGALTNRFRPVEEEVLKIHGFSQVRFEVVIFEKDFLFVTSTILRRAKNKLAMLDNKTQTADTYEHVRRLLSVHMPPHAGPCNEASDDQSEGDGTSVNDSEKDYHEKNGAKTDNYSSETSHSEIEDLADDEEIATLEDTCNVQESSEFQSETEEGIPDATEHQYELGSVTIDRTEETDYRDEISVLQKGSVNQLSPTTCPLPSCNDDMLEDVACETITTVESESDDESFAAKDPRTDNAHVLDYKAKGIESLTGTVTHMKETPFTRDEAAIESSIDKNDVPCNHNEVGTALSAEVGLMPKHSCEQSGIEDLTDETHDYSKAVDEELKTDPCLSQYATEVDERAKGLITGFTESPCNQNGTIKDSLAAAHCLPYHESDEVDVEDNTNESPPAIHESPTSALLPMREFVVDSQRKEMFGESSKTSVSEISTELACFTSTGIQPKNDVDTVDDQAEEAVMSLGNTFDNAQPQSEDQVEHRKCLKEPSKEMIETEEVITSYSEFLSKTSDDQNHDGPGIPGDDDCVGGNSILTYSNESVAHDAGGDKDTGYDRQDVSGSGGETHKPKRSVSIEDDLKDYSDITALEYTPQTQRERECVLCGVRLSNIVEFKKHLRTKSHVENVRKDNDGRERWSCRSPPIGRKENYSLCPRNKNGTCPYGNQCTEPHSKKECEEWTERIGHRKRIIRFLSENLEKPDLENDISDMLSTNTMKSPILDFAVVKIDKDQHLRDNKKNLKHTWNVSVESEYALKRIRLVDLNYDVYFCIGKVHDISSGYICDTCDDMQEWTNPRYVQSYKHKFKYNIKIQFSADIYGSFQQKLNIEFGRKQVITKEFAVETLQETDIEEVKKEYKINESKRWSKDDVQVVPFKPIKRSDAKAEQELLQNYPLRDIMSDNFSKDLTPSPTKDNYKPWMHMMLYVEEHERLKQISKYNMITTLKLDDGLPPLTSTDGYKYAEPGHLFARIQFKEKLSLESQAGRLILQNTNTVWLSPTSLNSSEEEKKVYETKLEYREADNIDVELSEQCVLDLQLRKGQALEVEVQIQLNRVHLCELHEAVEEIQISDLVCPEEFPPLVVHIPAESRTSKKSYSQLKQCNDNQWDAVAKCESPTQQKSPPLLIVGPFGTGKTYTIAQCTKHVLRTPGNRVLICTHSNSEADIYIRDYFQHIYQEGNVEAKPLRIYYQERRIETVSADVQKFCLLQTDEMSARVRFRAPNEKDIEDHRVIVTTMGSSKLLTRLKLKRGYFTHIFLDEAAQVLESETLIPLSLSGTYTRVVLAGDHMQMSPELFSKFAKQEQFSTSLLERLYNKYPKGSPYTIMLCKNYRTNQHIIEFMSRTLYDNKVVAEKNPPQHPQFYPLTFYTAMGREVCNGIKQGYYNQAEISEVTDHVRFIQATWPKEWGEFDEKSICVVAPYFMQIALLRHQLRSVGLAGVTVERVGNVQGKQYRVMIISTVRTKLPKDVEDEEDVDLGFLSNIKLINTAITRAQSLVIAVGDPVALCTISKCRKFWDSFIRECNEHNSLHGLTFDTIQRLCQQSPHSLNPDAEEFYPLNDPFESTRSGAFGTVQRIRTRNNSIEENWKTYRSNPSAPSKAKSEQYCKCSVVTPTTTESAFHTAYVVNARPLSVVNPDMKDGNTNNNFNGGTGQLHNVHADMTPRQDQDGVKDNMQTLGHVTFSNEGNQVSQQTTPIVMQPQVQSSMSYTYFPIPTPVFNMKPPSALMNPAMIQKHSKHPYNPPPPNFSFPPNVSQSVSQPFFWNQNTPPQQGNFYGNNVMNMFAGANYGFMGANGPNAQQHFNPGYMGPNMYGGNTQTQVQGQQLYYLIPPMTQPAPPQNLAGSLNVNHSSTPSMNLPPQTNPRTGIMEGTALGNEYRTSAVPFLRDSRIIQEKQEGPIVQNSSTSGFNIDRFCPETTLKPPTRKSSSVAHNVKADKDLPEGHTLASQLRRSQVSEALLSSENMPSKTNLKTGISAQEKLEQIGRQSPNTVSNMQHSSEGNTSRSQTEMPTSVKAAKSGYNDKKTPEESNFLHTYPNTQRHWQDIGDIERASYPRNQKGRKNGIHAAENAADVLCQNRQLSDQRDAQESNEFIAEGATYCTDSFSLLRKQTPSTISSEVDQIRNETKMSRSSSSTEVPFPVQTTAEIRAVDIMHFGNKKCVDASQEFDSNEKLKLSSSGKTHTPFEQMRKCSGTNTAFKRDPEVLPVKSYSEILQSRRYSPDEPESKDIERASYPRNQKGRKNGIHAAENAADVLCQNRQLSDQRDAQESNEFIAEGATYCTDSFSLLRKQTPSTISSEVDQIRNETKMSRSSSSTEVPFPVQTTAEIRAVDIMHFGNKKCVDASQENDSNEKLKLSSSGKTHTPFEQMRKCSGTNTAFKRDPEVLRVRSYSEILQSRRYSPDEPESKESQNSETGKKGIDAEVSFRPKYRQILKKVPKLPKPRLAKASQMEEKSLTGIEEHTTTASLLKSTIKPTLKKGPGRVYKETRQNLFSLAPANAIPSSTYEQDRSNTSKGKTNDKQNSMTSKGVAATCQPPMTKTRTNRRYSDCVTSLTKYAITQEKANCTGTEPPKGDLTIRTVIDNSQHNLQKRDDTERDANIKIEKNLSNYVQKSAGTPFIEIRRKRPKLKGSILDLSEELDVAVEQRTIIQRKCPPSWADIVRENHQ
ncbi:uncharacterized protein LOC128221916 isoform X2 [Mya arenaria]|uniref:uncharacterized protein LOC128221916 isoform X2 n=1 Tax=Mya arenaria TaxID=6604 RepID=UPI0022E2818A|nr:uncharacterized protein LOC128221916 isoform X2 [Mya arenaria]